MTTHQPAPAAPLAAPLASNDPQDLAIDVPDVMSPDEIQAPTTGPASIAAAALSVETSGQSRSPASPVHRLVRADDDGSAWSGAKIVGATDLTSPVPALSRQPLPTSDHPGPHDPAHAVPAPVLSDPDSADPVMQRADRADARPIALPIISEPRPSPGSTPTSPAISAPSVAPEAGVSLIANPAAALSPHPAASMQREAMPAGNTLMDFQPRTAPLRQIAPALMALHTADDGTRHMALQLHPEALGEVRVHITRADDMPIRVEIIVTREATLALLRQDTQALQRALDAAGIPATNRELVFQLAAPTSATGDPGAATMHAPADDSQRQDERGTEPRPARSATAPSAAGTPVNNHAPPVAALPGWARAGLDITA